jgi:hypothetical protein
LNSKRERGVDADVSEPLDSVGVGMYLQEAYELADGLLYRLDQLEKSHREWIEARSIGDREAAVHPRKFDRDAFQSAGRRTIGAQSTVFGELEAFLAAWARLSLIFWPAPPRRSPRASFTSARGLQLRSFLRLSEDHPLANRALRDAWMHTDERFDAAVLSGRLGNRHQFVHTAGVRAALEHSVRVVDVESLTVHLRDAEDAVVSIALLPLRDVLLGLVERREEAFRERFHELRMPVNGLGNKPPA